jgi:hypothetical protein
MSANNVILPKNLQASKLKFGEPKVLNNGSRAVYISYEGEKLTLQTPLMSLPYGVGDFNDKPKPGVPPLKGAPVDDGPKLKKYDLSVSFRGMDTSPALQTFLAKMQDVEKVIKEKCFENRLTWLRDDCDGMKTLADRLFSPIVKYDKDKETGKVVGKYPPTMKVKLPFDNNTETFTFDSMDMEGNELDFKSIMTKLKGAKARLIIQLGGLWFAGGKYGCTWKVVKSRFETVSKSAVDFVQDSDDEDDLKKTDVHSDEDVEEDALTHAEASSPIAKLTKKVASTTIEESDVEDEDDVDIPPPPPAPKKAAKKVPEPEPEEEEEVVEDAEEEEAEEDHDSEMDEEDVPPPPPPKKTTVKRTTAKKA